MAEVRDIKYINREFGDFRNQLIEYSKNYFPDTYNDFSPTSPGMMFIEMASYVGDVLSFYQDTQLQETFLQHAQNPGNLYTLAYMMGYRPKVTGVAEVELEVTQNVAATSAPNYTPNWTQALRIAENSTLKATSSGNPKFFIKDPVDFTFSSSYDPTEVTISSIDGGNPAEFLLKKKVKAISGEVKTTSFSFTTAEKFTTITIDDTNIIGIVDIVDSDENIWYEVGFLGQDTLFVPQQNTGTDKNLVPNLLQLQKVSRRFVTRFNSTGQLTIQFGAGIAGDNDSTFLPNPNNIVNSSGVGVNSLDTAYDPSNFLFTNSYGLAPSDTTLTVRYLVGGGVEANVPANTITSKENISVSGTNLTYQGTVAFNNPSPASGGRDGDSVEELRQNSLRAFSEQGRAVTLQDYTVRALSLPSKYGSIAKAYVTQDELTNSNTEDSVLDNNPLSLSLYVLAYNSNTNLITGNSSLKTNLKKYMSEYMMLTDAINIKDAFIINVGVKFDIITLPNYISRDVLLNCTNTLKDYFDISKWTINQPINLSSLYTLLDRVKGVQTVQKIEIVNKVGGNYSQYGYDIKGATRNNIVYPSYDPCVFEVKFPNEDIQGRVTTL